MNLIFIRHGFPDYETDTLTETGKKEAYLLAQMMKNWKIDDIYVSPMGRAQETAKPLLIELNREAVTLDWLSEVVHKVDDLDGEKKSLYYVSGEYMNTHGTLTKFQEWMDTDGLNQYNIVDDYQRTIDRTDEFLSSYGYERDNYMYKVKKEAKRNSVIVVFCHLGITQDILSHIMNIPLIMLKRAIMIPTTGVTIISSVEHNRGNAYFTAQTIGNTSHLYGSDLDYPNCIYCDNGFRL